VWKDKLVLCTACYNMRAGDERFDQRLPALRASFIGWPDKLWLVHDGKRQSGPFSTDELIKLLRNGKVDWLSNLWREPMRAWLPAAQIFSIPELSDDGQIRLIEPFPPEQRHRYKPKLEGGA
jgi:uncharacterized protein DUF4339